MDSLTQAVLGATVQGIGMGRQQGRKALVYGAILGTLPDLDVFIRYADPVSSMTYHRGFSHSVFVLAALAALIAWAVKKRYPDAPYSGWRLFFTSAASLITHPLLDAFTVYGTQLLWPFTPTPQQWSGVFIIDPLYTVPMLLALGHAAWHGLTRNAWRGLLATFLWGCAYLAFGAFGSHYHAERVRTMLEGEGIAVRRVMATPLPLTNLVFRAVAETDNGDYIEAVSGYFDQNPPEHIRLPHDRTLFAPLAHDPLYQRLDWFTDGWLRADDVDGKLVVSDLRMGFDGALTFRFVMAERDAAGNWQTITPYHYEDGVPEMRPLLRRLWPRLWGNEPPLPLSDWAAGRTE